MEVEDDAEVVGEVVDGVGTAGAVTVETRI